MRIAGLFTVLLGIANCNAAPPQAEPPPKEAADGIAYEAVEATSME
jgi:hypothetical protein